VALTLLPATFTWLYLVGIFVIATTLYARYGKKLDDEMREVLLYFTLIFSAAFLLLMWYAGQIFVVTAWLDYVMWLAVVFGAAYSLYLVAKIQKWIS